MKYIAKKPSGARTSVSPQENKPATSLANKSCREHMFGVEPENVLMKWPCCDLN